MEQLIYTGKVCGAIASIVAIIVLIVRITRWVDMQKEQDVKITKLEARHNADMKALNDENCLIIYGLLSVLKAYKGDASNVDDAIDKIEKHLNEKAHK